MRGRPGPAGRRAAVLAVVVALALGWLGVAPPEGHADTPGPPIFGSVVSTTAFLGDTNAPTAPQLSDCPAGSVVTGLVVGLKQSEYVASVAPACAPVQSEDGVVSLGPTAPVNGADFLGNPDPGGGVQDSTCPSEGLVNGYRGNDSSGNVDALGAICPDLSPNGEISGGAFYPPLVGTDNEVGNGTDDCPDGAVAVGITGAFRGDTTEEDLYSFALRCRTLVFPSTTPEDINLAWPTALPVSSSGTGVQGRLTATGQDRWYRFPVVPDSRVTVTLSNLPADYDLTVFRDIGQAFDAVTTTSDLNRLSAEFAGDAYSPSVFSPSVFSPSVFSPSVFSPSVFSPSVFSPSVFSPSVFSPSVFSPSVFSPSVFSPSVFSPSVFSPAVDAPSVFSPSVFSPSVFSPSVFSDAYSSAQTRSLIGVSARDGTADESISTDTWNATGSFYVRVQGRNGGFVEDPYTVTVTATGGGCTGTLGNGGSNTITGAAGPQTVIITDSKRLPGTAAEKQTLATTLTAFAAQTQGTVVDLVNSSKIRTLNDQADGQITCPYAKNLVAQATRDVINSYRGPNLKYVVIIGADAVVPFFRYPDQAGLGPEENYRPPMADRTGSHTSLAANYLLSQDAYGSRTDVMIKGSAVPVPDLAVGRLVESPTQITATLQAYLDKGGASITPTSTLTTGYDFLTDAADAVAADLKAGVPAGRNDALITDADVPPTTTTANGTPDRRHSWTATDLRTALLGSRHDITFLAGHFSANNTLAADYDTTVDAREIAAAPIGTFRDSLVYSAGCHSGYTIVDGEGVPGVTVGLDWTEAFARQGATLIAGTGYQYGDTDFLAYSEKLYAGFTRQLRYGAGAVAVGPALVAAKQDYLSTTSGLGGIDQKAVLEATLYGLPMQGVTLPGGRLTRPGSTSAVSPATVTAGPGLTLGLATADLTSQASPIRVNRTLTNLSGGTITATYLRVGTDGVSTDPAAPALPLATVDVTDDTGQQRVLRGAGWRSGTYTDTDGVIPLTGAPATETHSVHTPFSSPAFYPARIAVPNHFDALAGAASQGRTRLLVTPAQYRSDGSAAGTSTERAYSSVGVRLFYSANVTTYAQNQPALAAPPTLSDVTSEVQPNGSVKVSADAVGDPSAGLQSVWVTYTGERGHGFHGRWASVNLTQKQKKEDSTRWTGTIPAPTTGGRDPAQVRFLVQAVNGVGLVGADDDRGRLYVPGVPVGPGSPGFQPPSHLDLDAPPTTGAYGDTVTVRATLTDDTGAVLAGRRVNLAIGSSSTTAVTDGAGIARADVPLTLTPGTYAVTAGFDGDATARASGAGPVTFALTKQATALQLISGPSGPLATLSGRAGLPLREQTVVFTARDAAGTVVGGRSVATDRLGQAELPGADLPASTTTVTASFGTSGVAVPGGSTVDLTDPIYAGAERSVTLPAGASAAAADAYAVVQGGTLIVGSPGVLANDTGTGRTARLVAAPSVGTVALQSDGSFLYTPPEDFVGTATFGYAAVVGRSASEATVTITVTDEPTASLCTIRGTASDDTLTGTAGRDIVCGFGGNDTLRGLGGNDILVGGPGRDTLEGGDGHDLLLGRADDDTLSGGDSGDLALGGAGNDTVTGDAGSDLLSGGTGTDRVYGGTGSDLLDVRDGAGGDLADGGDGTDAARSDPGDTVRGVP